MNPRAATTGHSARCDPVAAPSPHLLTGPGWTDGRSHAAQDPPAPANGTPGIRDTREPPATFLGLRDSEPPGTVPGSARSRRRRPTGRPAPLSPARHSNARDPCPHWSGHREPGQTHLQGHTSQAKLCRIPRLLLRCRRSQTVSLELFLRPDTQSIVYNTPIIVDYYIIMCILIYNINF